MSALGASILMAGLVLAGIGWFGGINAASEQSIEGFNNFTWIFLSGLVTLVAGAIVWQLNIELPTPVKKVQK